MTGKLLLCTDLDQTLIANGAAVESPGAMALLKHWLASHDIRLAYVSGRSRALVEAAIKEFDLPLPHHVIGDVGTTLYHVDEDGHWQADAGWSQSISEDWGGRSSDQLAEILGEPELLDFQPQERQGQHKLSYFSAPGSDVTPAVRSILHKLNEQGIRARAVTSETHSTQGEPETGFVDILPRSASKYHAIRYLMQHSGFALENTVFSGDSGNDLEVLASPLPAILVANASEQVRQQARQAAETAGHPDALYLATGGWQAMNGCYAAGILEGIAYYHPAWADWFSHQVSGAA